MLVSIVNEQSRAGSKAVDPTRLDPTMTETLDAEGSPSDFMSGGGLPDCG